MAFFCQPSLRRRWNLFPSRRTTGDIRIVGPRAAAVIPPLAGGWRRHHHGWLGFLHDHSAHRLLIDHRRRSRYRPDQRRSQHQPGYPAKTAMMMPPTVPVAESMATKVTAICPCCAAGGRGRQNHRHQDCTFLVHFILRLPRTLLSMTPLTNETSELATGSCKGLLQ